MNAKEIVSVVKDVIGYALFALLCIAFFILYLFATPDQLSGEADWNEAALEAAGEGVL